MRQKDILLIVATIFMTVVAWVFLELKSIRDTTPTENEIKSYTLNYEIDPKTLDLIETKQP